MRAVLKRAKLAAPATPYRVRLCGSWLSSVTVALLDPGTHCAQFTRGQWHALLRPESSLIESRADFVFPDVVIPAGAESCGNLGIVVARSIWLNLSQCAIIPNLLFLVQEERQRKKSMLFGRCAFSSIVDGIHRTTAVYDTKSSTENCIIMIFPPATIRPLRWIVRPRTA